MTTKKKVALDINSCRPIASRIIVERIDVDYLNGVYVPESAKEGSMNSLRGKVIATGEEVELVEVGDIVLYGKYSGTKFNIGPAKTKDGSPTYMMMNDVDVLCIIKDEKEAKK